MDRHIPSPGVTGLSRFCPPFIVFGPHVATSNRPHFGFHTGSILEHMVSRVDVQPMCWPMKHVLRFLLKLPPMVRSLRAFLTIFASALIPFLSLLHCRSCVSEALTTTFCVQWKASTALTPSISTLKVLIQNLSHRTMVLHKADRSDLATKATAPTVVTRGQLPEVSTF